MILENDLPSINPTVKFGCRTTYIERYDVRTCELVSAGRVTLFTFLDSYNKLRLKTE